MNAVKISAGDTVIMKKKHPCSSDTFRILRVGSDVRIMCCGCGRDLTFERQVIEKMIKKVVTAKD